MRKLVIGFVSLCLVLGAYLLYNRLSGSPAIDTGPQIDIIESASDVNAVGFDNEIGKIGDVGLGPVRKAEYVTLNENKEVEREFGFEKLLNETRDIWDIEKPYMNIFRRNFKCYITADKGKVQIETAVGRTTPKDATFSSNVVVHILSGPPDDVRESFVYLDSIVFLSDRSLLSTAGPVEFVSQDIRMTGTGMELIYNELTERLEYFEIKDLQSLNITGSSAAIFSAGMVQNKAPAEVDHPAGPQQPNKSVVAVEAQKPKSSEPETISETEQKQGIYYKCTFKKNVLIDTPEQLIFAADKLCINDIFWAESSSDQAAEDDADAPEDVETGEPARQAVDNSDVQQAVATATAEPNESSGRNNNIVVTCDGGFVVLPKDSVRAQEDAAKEKVQDAVASLEPPGKFDEDTDRTRFSTERIDYNAATGDGVADGLSELTFYVGSATSADSNEPSVPVKVTARKTARFSQTSSKIVFTGDCQVRMPQSSLTEPRDITFTASEITVNIPSDKSKKPDMFAAGPAELVFYMEDANRTDTNQHPLPVTVNSKKQARFLAASNQIIFEGDSRCTMIREEPNALTNYMLLSEQITVDLPADMNDGSVSPEAGIKHLTATGEVVRLATTKTAKPEGTSTGQLKVAETGESLGGVEMKCTRFDYDSALQLFLATGPGVIKIDNSRVQPPNEPVGRFSIQKPCWAVLDGFDTLRYFIQDNRIVAETSPRRRIHMDYIPAAADQFDEHVTAQASKVEALLHQLPSGKTELSTLTAVNGVEYEDKNNRFMGSDLFYDHNTAVLKVQGDKSQPCYYNGILVDSIEMNVETGKVQAEIVGPGSIQINRKQP